MSQKAQLKLLLEEAMAKKQSLEGGALKVQIRTKGRKPPLHPGVGHTGAGEGVVKTVGMHGADYSGGDDQGATDMQKQVPMDSMPEEEISPPMITVPKPEKVKGVKYTTAESLPYYKIDNNKAGGVMAPLIKALLMRGRKDEGLKTTLDKLKGGKRITQAERKNLQVESADILTSRNLKPSAMPKGGFLPILAASLLPMAADVISRLAGKGVSGGCFCQGGILSGGGASAPLQDPSMHCGGKKADADGNNAVVAIKERENFKLGFQPKAKPKIKVQEAGDPIYGATLGDAYDAPEGEGVNENWNPKGVGRKLQSGTKRPVPPNLPDQSKNLHNSKGGSLVAVKKAGTWLQHVKQYQQEHGCSYKEALKGAAKTW